MSKLRIVSWSRRTARLRTLAAQLCLAVAAWSCTEATIEPVPVASISVTPPTTSVRAGTPVTLVARPLNGAGAAVAVRTIIWSSNNTAVATVSANGVVSTLAPGEARIAASAFGKSATATITVTPRVVASVTVTPATVSMRVGVSTPLTAQTLDVDGLALTGRAVVWSSGNTAVATVNAQGVVTGVSPGAATITATSEGRSGQAAVTVTVPAVQTVAVTPSRDTLAVGTARNLSVVLRDANNAVLTGRTVSWVSSNAAVATVSSTGVVNAISPGTATITATSEGRNGSATIVVLARLASAVVLSPASATLIVGSTQPLTTQITDDQGNLITNRPVTYASNLPAIATVSATGVVAAVSVGTATITATSEGKVGTATVTVIAVPVASVQVTPNTATVQTGTTRALVATARDASGATLSGRVFQWTSGAPSIASVSSSGIVTGLSPGVAIVLATVDGITASATVTVIVPPVATVVVSPADPVIPLLGTIQLSASVRDAAGGALSGRVVTWSSADESIAFVSSTGFVVSFKVGNVRITATSEGVSASTLVTVR
ncbi:MAG: Ig-like domain-containing protein [Gemmatimonadaceae bacterium]|nr:Ig-like domain-containing protein [Gemmatimonadaceae bacterium]